MIKDGYLTLDKNSTREEFIEGLQKLMTMGIKEKYITKKTTTKFVDDILFEIRTDRIRNA